MFLPSSLLSPNLRSPFSHSLLLFLAVLLRSSNLQSIRMAFSPGSLTHSLGWVQHSSQHCSNVVIDGGDEGDEHDGRPYLPLSLVRSFSFLQWQRLLALCHSRPPASCRAAAYFPMGKRRGMRRGGKEGVQYRVPKCSLCQTKLPGTQEPFDHTPTNVLLAGQ